MAELQSSAVVADEVPVSYRHLTERVSARWGDFQSSRAQHLRQGERYGKVPEKAAEDIVCDFLKDVLDWAGADINEQVERADLVVTRLGVKLLLIETKRPGALYYRSAAFCEALRQAHGYAREQGVDRVAVSDGRVFYTEDRVYSADGALVQTRPRTYFELDGEPDVASMWWVSLHGIYRPRPGDELDLCRPRTRAGPTSLDVAAGVVGTGAVGLLHHKYHLPEGCFGFVGDPSDTHTWHLPYLRADGSVDPGRLPKAVQALLTNYRGAITSSVPEEAVPMVLRRLAAAARHEGRMPGQCPKPAMAYVRLDQALRQFDLDATTGPLT